MFENLYVPELTAFILYYLGSFIFIYAFLPAPEKKEFKKPTDFYHFYSESVSIIHALNALIFGRYLL